ncbi:hypothetical protein PTE31013_02692 [Pandoraea terrigena]|uniref:Uncharacterized protein n=1 Tax=Pandoraea terrigena TaxID=2508292 RepID=A0A5E4VHN2_9BURK|nr:hypothetical protein PTE31013_02692 [Pandoraea terrigena]
MKCLSDDAYKASKVKLILNMRIVCNNIQQLP